MARFCSLFSGSSGNCQYIGTSHGGILIDAGVSARRLELALQQREIDPCGIRAIFVTHEHIDHTRGLRAFCKRYGTALWASAGTAAALEEQNAVDPGTVEVMSDAVEGDAFRITRFPTSHDCRESIGFRVELSDERTIGIATDLGVVTEEVRQALIGCDLIHIESNHDVRMLEHGPYPNTLKRRIMSDRGHLSNDACAAELPVLVKEGTTRIVLAHLSGENNRPMLARETAMASLSGAGMRENTDFLLEVAPPQNDGPVYLF